MHGIGFKSPKPPAVTCAAALPRGWLAGLSSAVLVWYGWLL